MYATFCKLIIKALSFRCRPT